jgi:hypothetical protein
MSKTLLTDLPESIEYTTRWGGTSTGFLMLKKHDTDMPKKGKLWCLGYYHNSASGRVSFDGHYVDGTDIDDCVEKLEEILISENLL